jgi:hypothetical protein
MINLCKIILPPNSESTFILGPVEYIKIDDSLYLPVNIEIYGHDGATVFIDGSLIFSRNIKGQPQNEYADFSLVYPFNQNINSLRNSTFGCTNVAFLPFPRA